MATAPALHLALNTAADELLSRDPFALLVGMLLDQQIPMERAFAGPHTLAQRLGTPTLDPVAVAGADPEQFAAVMARPPAVHRFPGSMAGRVQALARVITDRYQGDAARVWEQAASGQDLLTRLRDLPGFGEQKARIFVALLGKQRGVRPDGWREAAAHYGEEGSFKSVADVVDDSSLAKVRAFKQENKRLAREQASSTGEPDPPVRRPRARKT